MSKKQKEINPSDPVSRYVRKDMVVLKEDQTVSGALDSLRNKEIKSEILYLYVTDHDNKLTGVIPVRSFLTAKPDMPISSIIISSPIALYDSNTVLEACELFSNYRFLALPVLDRQNHLIGTVDISLFTDEVVSLAHQQQISNIFQLIGVHVSLGRKVSSLQNFRDRFPWLICNMASGIICAFIAMGHDAILRHVTILAIFITVVLALAESVSIQSTTLTLQFLVQRSVSWIRILGRLQKEILVSALLGAGAGLVIGFVAYVWKKDLASGLVVGLSICLAMITSCLLGVMVPAVIRAFRADPKIAAGPIVLAVTDIVTLLFYFRLAALLLK